MIMTYLSLVLWVSSSQAVGSELKCNSLPKAPTQALIASVQTLAAHRIWWGNLDAQLVGRIKRALSIQQCQDAQNRFQGQTLIFVADVRESSGAKAKPRYCMTRFKRLRGLRTEATQWGAWVSLGVQCSTSPRQIDLGRVDNPVENPSGSVPDESLSGRGLPYLEDCRDARCVIDSSAGRDAQSWDAEGRIDAGPRDDSGDEFRNDSRNESESGDDFFDPHH